jgi:hypothetical protein
MSEAFDALGYTSHAIWDGDDAQDLLDKVADELAQDKAVTVAILNPARNSPLIASHAYEVVSVDTAAGTLVLRNPWGIDGIGTDGQDDGYVRVTAQQAFVSFWGVISANV